MIRHTKGGINDLHESTSKWFAVYTKYKCEKYVADSLKKKGIHTYLPLLSKTRRYGNRKRISKLPLINCYVFVRIVKNDFIRVLESEYVLSFLKQGSDLISIPHHEIETLMRVVGEKEVAISSGKISSGSPVEVIAGNLTGIRGTVVEKKGKSHFVVVLDTLSMQLEMEIDRQYLAALA